MSRFFSEKHAGMVPYVPGEQPQDMSRFIKLNTNESPFPPSPLAVEAAGRAAERIQLYCDTRFTALREKMAEIKDVSPEEVIFTNGSDDILAYCFQAFCDDAHPAVFPDITYGLYQVFCDLYHIPAKIIPLKEDFTVDLREYEKERGVVVLVNPNAPTGIALPPSEIERLLQTSPERLVIVDEAYVDFGGKSCVPLIHRYPNLLVVGTFSKSRSLAGARLGYGIGDRTLISDLNTIRNSLNPYNVNAMTQAAGLGALQDEAYTLRNCRAIRETREAFADSLRQLGFEVLPSSANFVFARHPKIGGMELYQKLKERGILIRHFDSPRICDYNRITIGLSSQMDRLVGEIKNILGAES